MVAEVGYLLGRAGGAKIEAAFLRSLVQETFTIVDLELADYERMAELVETYADFPRLSLSWQSKGQGSSPLSSTHSHQRGSSR